MKFLKLDSAVIKQARKSLMVGNIVEHTHIFTEITPGGKTKDDGTDEIN